MDKEAEKAEIPQTFDFADGCGPVPAHRHENGGGWVAETARVAPTAYVGTNARVYGNARVQDDVLVRDDARVYGYAVVRDHVQVRTRARVHGEARLFDRVSVVDSAEVFGLTDLRGAFDIVSVTRIDQTPTVVTDLFDWPVILISSPEKRVSVGCESHPLAYWRENAATMGHSNAVDSHGIAQFLALLELVYGKARKKRRAPKKAKELHAIWK